MKAIYFISIGLSILLWVSIYYNYQYKSQIPITSNSDVKLIAYEIDDPLKSGTFRFVMKCLNTGLEKQYMVKDGNLYFMRYMNENITSGEENNWVGGISCTQLAGKG